MWRWPWLAQHMRLAVAISRFVLSRGHADVITFLAAAVERADGDTAPDAVPDDNVPASLLANAHHAHEKL